MTRARARLGLLVPFTNTNFEPDFALMMPADITLHSARMGGYDEDEIPDADQMAGLGASDLDDPLRLLQGVKPDAILYGCTSATLTHGPAFDRDLAARIKAASGAETITAAGAIVAALRHLNIWRIGFGSPYVAAINDLAVDFLSQSGIETVARSEVDTPLSNEAQGALTPEDVFAIGTRADHPDAQAVLLSCTDMRGVETIARLEAHLGKPVISSNQAMAWETLRRLDIPDPIPGFGQILEHRS